jgi:hypothetical protein
MTIVRSAGNCPSAYNSTTQTNTAFQFDSGDTIACVFTDEQLDDIQNNLALALPTTGGTMTGAIK